MLAAQQELEDAEGLDGGNYTKILFQNICNIASHTNLCALYFAIAHNKLRGFRIWYLEQTVFYSFWYSQQFSI